MVNNNNYYRNRKILDLHPLTQADKAFRLLEEKIVTCQLFPGSFLTEKEICVLTGFGRTPVREAVLKLSSGLLLAVLPRSGIKIKPVDYHETMLALEVRILLERMLIKKVIENIGEFEKTQFKLFAEKIRATEKESDQHGFAKIDYELNRFIASTSKQIVAAQNILPLHSLARRIGYLATTFIGPDEMLASTHLHAAMCDSISKGNIGRSNSCLQEIFDLNVKLIKLVLSVDISQRPEDKNFRTG